MASRSFSLSFGQDEFAVVEGTSAPGAGNVEVRVDLATIPTISGGSGAGNASTIDLIEKIVRHLVGKGTAIG